MAFAYQPPASVAVTSTGEQILAVNPSRHLLRVINTGANPANVSLIDNPLNAGVVSVVLAAGAEWAPTNVPANAVWASSAAGTTVVAMED